MPLVTRLRQDGLVVYGFGRSTTPEGFREACNRFIDVDTLETTKSAEVPRVATAAAEKTGAVDQEVIKLLIDAYQNAKRDPQGFASLSEVGQRAANRSSFDTRNYGFARLSDLFEAVPGFVVDRRDGGAFVKRVR